MSKGDVRSKKFLLKKGREFDMSWELPTYSFQQSQPLTPTKTPTSPASGQTTFQAPKTESSFYDPRVTWNTADPHAISPDFLEIQHLSSFFPPDGQPSTPSGPKNRVSDHELETEVASRGRHPSPNPSLSLPPVEPSRQLSSSPDPTSAKTACSNASNFSRSPNFGLALDTGSPIPSAGSIQTPPPTGTVSSRQKAQWLQEEELECYTSYTTRRMSVPNFESAIIGQDDLRSQINLSLKTSNTEYSPNAFALSVSGPSTAPACPQNRLFWDSTSTEGMEIDFSANLGDSLNTNPPSASDRIDSPSEKHNLGQTSSLSSFLDFPSDNRPSFPTFASSDRGQTKSFSMHSPVKDGSSHRKPLANGVNPSLLCSSPGHPTDPLTNLVSSKRVLDENSFQPYAYQIQEARREEAVDGIVKIKRKPKPTRDSPAVKAALQTLREDDDTRLSPKRASTDSIIIRSTSKRRLADIGNETHTKNSQAIVQRRSSPIKGGNDSSSHNLGLKRTAVAFMIDASGRARTETKTTIDANNSTVISRRQHSDSLYNTSDSETSSDESALVISTSQASSFSFNYPQTEHVGRNKNLNHTKSHSHKSSSTSTYSLGAYAECPLGLSDRSTGSGSRFMKTRVPNSMPVFSGKKANADVVSEDETTLGSEGTAQCELRKILKKKQGDGPTLNSTRKSPQHEGNSNRHISSFCGDAPLSNKSADTFSSISKFSRLPVTELARASPLGQRYKGVRCVCGNTNSQEQLITCKSCDECLHLTCIGLDVHRVPILYICPFCTEQKPNIPRGRSRGTYQTTFAQSSSPTRHRRWYQPPL